MRRANACGTERSRPIESARFSFVAETGEWEATTEESTSFSLGGAAVLPIG